MKKVFKVLMLISLLLTLIGARPASAQQPYIKHYSLDQGLPSSQVWAVYQDRTGFIWFATTSGTCRYNGRDCKNFTITDGLPDNQVNSIAEDDQGNIWFGTVEGAARYDGTKIVLYRDQHGLDRGTISKILVAADGSIWFATQYSGIKRLKGTQWETIDTTGGLPSNRVLALYQDAQRRIWIGTSEGLSLFDRGQIVNFTTRQGLPRNFIWSIGEDADQNLWVGMADSWISRRVGASFENFHLTDNNVRVAVSSIKPISPGHLWVATRGAGVYKWNGSSFARFTTSNGLKSDTIYDLYSDREKNIWLATGSGVSKIMSQQFLNLTPHEGLLDESVRCLFRDDKGFLWIGTPNGVSKWDGKKFIHFTMADGLVGSSVWVVAQDHLKRIWIGTEAGVSLFDGKTFRNYAEKEGLNVGTRTYDIFEDGKGVLWFGTTLGLYKFEKNRFVRYTVESGLPHNRVRAIHPDGKGGLWLASRGGLSHFDGTSFTNYTRADGLANNVVWSIARDKNGVLWLGTDGGLSRFDGTKFTNYTSRNGLANDVIWFVLPVEEDKVWIGSNNGVDLIDTRLRQNNKVIAQYNHRNGLVGSEAITQHGILQDPDGSIWFSLVGGITHYFPSLDIKNSIPPPIVITQVTAKGEDLPRGILSYPASSVESPQISKMPYGKNDFAFQFVGLSFKDERDVRYSYQLVGYDKTWSEETRIRSVRYTNLKQGTYTFKVRARNRDGVWSTEPATFSFRIEPPFWLTSWFQSLAILVIGISIYSVYRWRTHKLKNQKQRLEGKVRERTKELAAAYEKILELDQLKTQFFSNISHELRTPLTLILGPLEEVVSGGYGSVDHAAKNELHRILYNARRLLRLINQLLDLSRLESRKVPTAFQYRDFRVFVQDIVSAFETFAHKKKLRLLFNAPQGFPKIYFDPDKMDKIIYNLISNACKFTHSGGTVEVTLSRDDTNAVFQICDSGIGIKPTELPYIFDRFRQADGSMSREYEGSGIGLSLVKELVELHHGSIACQSEYGKGTTFRLLLPLGNAHLRPGEIVDADDEIAPTTKAAIELAGLEVIEGDTWESSLEMEHEKTLLIADDNPHMRHYLASVLKDEYNLLMAKNGREALEKLNTETISLVIADVMMPQMSGYELLQAIRFNEAWSHMPVIMLTAKADLAAKIEGFKEGANEYLAKPFDARELKARVKNLLRLSEQELIILKQNKELQLMNQRLEELSITDPLTKLYNRRHFNDLFRAEFRKSERHQHPFSVLMADVDHFKRINDTFGHLVGDRVLEEIAQLLKGRLRPGDVIARFGGEEFIILAHMTDLKGGIQLGERLRETLAEKTFDYLGGVHITVSIGVSTLAPLTADEPEDLLRQADMALYTAKTEGRNRVVASNNVPHVL